MEPIVYIPDIKDGEHLVKSKESPGMYFGQKRDENNKNPQFVKWIEKRVSELCPQMSEEDIEHKRRMQKLKEEQAEEDLNNKRRKAEHDDKMRKNEELKDTLEIIRLFFGLYREVKGFLLENPEIANGLRRLRYKVAGAVSAGFGAAKDTVLILFDKKEPFYKSIQVDVEENPKIEALKPLRGNNADEVDDWNAQAEAFDMIENRLADMPVGEEQKKALFLLIQYALKKAAGIDKPENIMKEMGLSEEERDIFAGWIERTIEKNPEICEKDKLVGLLEYLENGVGIQKDDMKIAAQPA